MAKTYNINCGTPINTCNTGTGKLKCPIKLDSKCVIYTGDKMDCVGAGKGSNVSMILEGLCGRIENLTTQLNLLEQTVNNRFTEVNNRIDILEQSVNSRFTEVNNNISNLTNRVNTLTIDIKNVDDRVTDLIDNFCEYVSPCLAEATSPSWTLREGETGCSTSKTKYTAFNPDTATGSGYYVETYEDTNPMSSSYGQKRVDHISSRDEECVGQGANWVAQTGTFCSNVDTEVQEELSVSETSSENIYGYRKYIDTNPTSESYESVEYRRHTTYDNICNPPLIPLYDEEGCTFCTSVAVLVMAGASVTTTFPEGFDSSGCISRPNLHDTNATEKIDFEMGYTITDPNHNGWKIKKISATGYETVIKEGTGDESGTITDTIRVSYTKYKFKDDEGNIVEKYSCPKYKNGRL